MVYAHNVVRVTLSGTMFNGLENWSTGFFLGKRDDNSEPPTQLAADAIRDAWTTFFTTTNSFINTNYRFTQCKLATIKDDGHTDLSQVVYSYPTATVQGGNGTGAALPPQCALVVTLTTNRPRGLASKGRMYLPGISGAVGTDGKVPGTNMASIATNLQAFFNTVNGSANVGQRIILASRGNGLLTPLTAQNEWVTGLKVGDVIDTQRRRRNGLTEVYTLKTIS